MKTQTTRVALAAFALLILLSVPLPLLAQQSFAQARTGVVGTLPIFSVISTE
jgi:hypothetical protein